MSQQSIMLKGHAVMVEPFGGSAVAKVDASGGTVYYADNRQVSSTNNQGSIAPGGSQSFTSNTWLSSNGVTTPVLVTTTSVYDEWAAINPLAIGTGAVGSVFGRQGAVTGAAGDYTTAQISPAVSVVAQSATPAINTDAASTFSITALAQAITSMTTNLTGTPVRGQEIWVEIGDNGTARAITWGSSFSATSVPLPATTIVGQLLSVLLKWNVLSTTWECVDVRGGQPRSATDNRLALVAPFPVQMITTAVAPGSANMHGIRVVVPKTGILHDLTTWCGNAGTGHLMFAVYDTGQASAGVRTRLAVSGSLLNPGVANSWFTVYDPAIAVVEGQQLDLVYDSDSTTDTYGRSTAVANLNQLSLPANYLKPGNYGAADPTVNPYLGWFGANTFGTLPATIADAAVTPGDGPVFIMGRIG